MADQLPPLILSAGHTCSYFAILPVSALILTPLVLSLMCTSVFLIAMTLHVKLILYVDTYQIHRLQLIYQIM